jgi:hypothetical protein
LGDEKRTGYEQTIKKANAAMGVAFFAGLSKNEQMASP